MIKTELDDLTESAVRALRAMSPLVGSGFAMPSMSVEQGEDIVEGVLFILELYCRSAEVDLNAHLVRARDLVGDFLRADLEMQRDAREDDR